MPNDQGDDQPAKASEPKQNASFITTKAPTSKKTTLHDASSLSGPTTQKQEATFITTNAPTSRKTTKHEISSSSASTTHKPHTTFITRSTPKVDGRPTTSTRTRAETTNTSQHTTQRKTPNQATAKPTRKAITTTQHKGPHTTKTTKSVSAAKGTSTSESPKPTRGKGHPDSTSKTTHKPLPKLIGQTTRSTFPTVPPSKSTTVGKASTSTSSASSGNDSGSTLSNEFDGVGNTVKAVGIICAVLAVLVFLVVWWCCKCRKRRKAKSKALEQQGSFESPRQAPVPPSLAQSQTRYGDEKPIQDQPKEFRALESKFDPSTGDFLTKIKSICRFPNVHIRPGPTPELVSYNATPAASNWELASNSARPAAPGSRLYSVNPIIPRISEEVTEVSDAPPLGYWNRTSIPRATGMPRRKPIGSERDPFSLSRMTRTRYPS